MSPNPPPNYRYQPWFEEFFGQDLAITNWPGLFARFGEDPWLIATFLCRLSYKSSATGGFYAIKQHRDSVLRYLLFQSGLSADDAARIISAYVAAVPTEEDMIAHRFASAYPIDEVTALAVRHYPDHRVRTFWWHTLVEAHIVAERDVGPEVIAALSPYNLPPELEYLGFGFSDWEQSLSFRKSSENGGGMGIIFGLQNQLREEVIPFSEFTTLEPTFTDAYGLGLDGIFDDRFKCGYAAGEVGTPPGPIDATYLGKLIRAVGEHLGKGDKMTGFTYKVHDPASAYRLLFNAGVAKGVMATGYNSTARVLAFRAMSVLCRQQWLGIPKGELIERAGQFEWFEFTTDGHWFINEWFDFGLLCINPGSGEFSVFTYSETD